MTKDQIINQAIEDWTKQGRSPEQIYGIKNFMTGRGKQMADQLIFKENLAWLNNERCENCGEPKDGKLITLCDNCLED